MNPVVAPAPGATLATPPDPELDEPAAARASERSADDEPRVAASIIALLAFTIPLASAYSAWSPPGSSQDWTRSVVLAPFDIVLLVAVGWVALRPRLIVDLFASLAVRVATAFYAAVFVMALVAGFGWPGLALGLRLGAGLAVIAVVSTGARTYEARRFMIGAIALVGVLQAVLAMAQARHGIAFGISYVDFSGRLYPFGHSRAGRGGLTHPYHLAVLLVVCQGAALLGLRHTRGSRWPWLIALATMGSGLAVTYTRGGLLGQLMLLVCLVLGRGRSQRRLMLPAALAVVVGLAVGGVAFGDGWVARSKVDTAAGANLSTNRTLRLREAEALLRAHPVTGVGPGNYVDALHDQKRLEYLPAHDLVAQDAAEMGIAGGIAVLALLALLGLRVLRGGAWTGAIVLPMMPFLLLDAYPYVFATGLALAAIWLGLARVSLRPVEPDPALEPGVKPAREPAMEPAS